MRIRNVRNYYGYGIATHDVSGISFFFDNRSFYVFGNDVIGGSAKF